jgi:hypothetical protein
MDPSASFIDRLLELSESDRYSEVELKINEDFNEVLDSRVFGDAIAGTNAWSWGLDELLIDDINIEGDECFVAITYSATGLQDDDKFFFGDHITGQAEVVIDAAGNVSFDEITAEVDSGVTESPA